jgi:hypothetical protein
MIESAAAGARLGFFCRPDGPTWPDSTARPRHSGEVPRRRSHVEPLGHCRPPTRGGFCDSTGEAHRGRTHFQGPCGGVERSSLRCSPCGSRWRLPGAGPQAWPSRSLLRLRSRGWPGSCSGERSSSKLAAATTSASYAAAAARHDKRQPHPPRRGRTASSLCLTLCPNRETKQQRMSWFGSFATTASREVAERGGLKRA